MTDQVTGLRPEDFAAMREAYTPRDVTEVPQLWTGGSRRNVVLSPDDFPGSPFFLVSANMNAVTGRRMALEIARCGGLGILTQDMPLERLKEVIELIKGADPWCGQALKLKPDRKVAVARDIIHKYGHGLIVVVDAHDKPIGVIAQKDLDGNKSGPHIPVRRIMRKDLVTVSRSATYAEAYKLMKRQRVDAAPVVNDDGTLIGVITTLDCVLFGTSNSALPPILRGPSLDSSGKLMVGLAVGINGTAVERAVKAVEWGANVVVVDTAHGHQNGALRTVRDVRAALGPSAIIVAGNVCTREGARDLFEAGASVAKIGVGPGAMCTTRVETGHGIPQFTAVAECALEARKHGKHVWADGGVTSPGEAVRLLGAGASRVMLGTVLAGTFESSAEADLVEGVWYKKNHGMAGSRSVIDRNEGHEDDFEAEIRGMYVEGVSEAPIAIKADMPSVLAVAGKYATGAQSGFSYSGSIDILTLHQRARFRVQTAAGHVEGTPHGKK